MTTSQSDRAAWFRALHQGAGAFVIPDPWDAGSARILAGLGFLALATSSGASAGILGRRDGKVRREEALAYFRGIVDATDLPVAAELETGFGDAPAVAAETIRLAAEVGLVGGSIEDATGDKDKPLFDIGLATERMAAAAEAARARWDFRSPSPRARRTSCAATRASMTPSGACRPSRRPAPTYCSRPACPTSRRCATSARR